MSAIPRSLKLGYTLFVAVLVPAYWWQYGAANFLWGSDVALLVTLLGLWLESSLLISMMALAVLLPELAWTLDFALRLLAGPGVIGFRGTRYMFDPLIPLFVRSLSLFHIALPVLLLWAVHRLGYHRRALLGQTLLCWLIFSASYLVTDPQANINWVFGFGDTPQQWLPGPLYLLLLMLLYPLLVCVPTHLLLRRLFPRAATR